MAAHPSTTDYSGRQVDLELLEHVGNTADFLSPSPVTPDVARPPRIVSGIQKAVQRYTKIFLTTKGTARLDPESGNWLYHRVAIGSVANMATLDHLYSIANATTLAAIRAADADTDTYGPIPDDERIVSTELRDLEIVRGPLGEGRVKVHVKLTTAAGEDYVFIIPVAAGIAG